MSEVFEDFIWRVTWLESERGWGQKTFRVEYGTKAEADTAIEASGHEIAEWYKTNSSAPDYYIIPDSVPVYEASRK
jgi:hypothetical protein